MNKNNKTINHIISLIFKNSRLIREHLRKEKKHPDPFSILRLEVLRYVLERKNPLMREVADYFCITPPSATSLVNSLVKLGMLQRLEDKNDRRVIRLYLTSKGKREIEKGFKEISHNMKGILALLNLREQKELIKILGKLSKIYEKSN